VNISNRINLVLALVALVTATLIAVGITFSVSH
jgi:hypothetical protein